MDIDKLISECELKHQETDVIYFILSKNSYGVIDNKEEYYISNLLEPSRHSIYDTETKELDRYKRMDIIYKMMNMCGFSPRFSQSIDLEQTFIRDMIVITIKPNLFITIKIFGESFYDGFFSKQKIVSTIKRAHDTRYINNDMLSDFKNIERNYKIDVIVNNDK